MLRSFYYVFGGKPVILARRRGLFDTCTGVFETILLREEEVMTDTNMGGLSEFAD
jgi:hypothetical protein